MAGRFEFSERRVLAGLRGQNGEVLRLIALQPKRNFTIDSPPVPVPGR